MVIGVIRTSTLRQEIESQKSEEENRRNLLDILDLTQKIGVLEQEIADLEQRREKIQDMYVFGDIDLKRYNQLNGQINVKKSDLCDKIALYRADIAVKTEIQGDKQDLDKLNMTEMKSLVCRFIHKIELKQYSEYWYNLEVSKPQRAETLLVTEIIVTLPDSELIIRYRYIPNIKAKHRDNMFVFDGKWTAIGHFSPNSHSFG